MSTGHERPNSGSGNRKISDESPILWEVLPIPPQILRRPPRHWGALPDTKTNRNGRRGKVVPATDSLPGDFRTEC